MTEMTRTYGDLVHLHLGERHDYLLNNPDYIKEVLFAGEEDMLRVTQPALKRVLRDGVLTCRDDLHRRQRTRLQPAFHQQRMVGYAKVIVDQATRLSERWQDGQQIDIHQEMLRLTMAIVIQALFGSDIESHGNDIVQILQSTVKDINKKNWRDKSPLQSQRLSDAACAHLDGMIYRMIDERRRSGIVMDDLLSLLLALQENDEGGSVISDQQVRDEMVTMLATGYETVGTALTWTWHLLSQHRDVEEEMNAEIDSVLGSRQPTFQDLPALSFTRMVFSESLRLYPPIWQIARQLARTCEIGGYLISAGSCVHMSQWVTHRDARYFPEPERFEPRRWTPEAVAKRPKLSYFPFGAGGRQCIGEGLAWTESVLTLATVAQRWKMQIVPGHRMEPEPLISLRPKYGLHVTLHRR